MEDLNAFVDELLNEHRPHGYYDAKDRIWRQPVYDAVGAVIPPEETRRIAAEQIVDRRESRATTAANNLLREIGKSGQLPLGWLDAAPHPLSIGGTRVRLGDAVPSDLEQWAIDERRDAATEFTSRSQACDGAEWLAKTLRARGLNHYDELVDP